MISLAHELKLDVYTSLTWDSTDVGLWDRLALIHLAGQLHWTLAYLLALGRDHTRPMTWEAQ